MPTRAGTGRTGRSKTAPWNVFWVLVFLASAFAPITIAPAQTESIRPAVDSVVETVDDAVGSTTRNTERSLPCRHTALASAPPGNTPLNTLFLPRFDGPIEILEEGDLDGPQGQLNDVCRGPSPWDFTITRLVVHGDSSNGLAPRPRANGAVTVQGITSSLLLDTLVLTLTTTTQPPGGALAADHGVWAANVRSLGLRDVDSSASDILVDGFTFLHISNGTIARDLTIVGNGAGSTLLIEGTTNVRHLVIRDVGKVVIRDALFASSILIEDVADLTMTGATVVFDSTYFGDGLVLTDVQRLDVGAFNLPALDAIATDLGSGRLDILGADEISIDGGGTLSGQMTGRLLAVADVDKLSLSNAFFVDTLASVPVLTIEDSVVEASGSGNHFEAGGAASRSVLSVVGADAAFKATALTLVAADGPCITLDEGASLRLESPAISLARCVDQIVDAPEATDVELLGILASAIPEFEAASGIMFDLTLSGKLVVQGGTYDGGSIAFHVTPVDGETPQVRFEGWSAVSGPFFIDQTEAAILLEEGVGPVTIKNSHFDAFLPASAMVAVAGEPAATPPSLTFHNNEVLSRTAFSAPDGRSFDEYFTISLSPASKATCGIRIDQLGSTCGGNVWPEYTGYDVNRDGIGEVVHEVEGVGTDRLPLVRPNSPPQLDAFLEPDPRDPFTIIQPGDVIRFSGFGYDPDDGDGIGSYEWDFGTDPPATSDSQIASFQYDEPGVYSVKLTGFDTQGAPGSILINITVDRANAAPIVSSISRQHCDPENVSPHFYRRDEICFRAVVTDPDRGTHDRLDMLYIDQADDDEAVVSIGDLRLSFPVDPLLDTGLVGENDLDRGLLYGFSTPPLGMPDMAGNAESLVRRSLQDVYYLDLDDDRVAGFGDLRLSGYGSGMRLRLTDGDVGTDLFEPELPARFAKDPLTGRSYMKIGSDDGHIEMGDLVLSGDYRGMFVDSWMEDVGAEIILITGTLRVLDRDGSVRVRWEWIDPGGGADGVGLSASHSFNKPGTYNVQVNLSDFGYRPFYTEYVLPTKIRLPFTPIADFVTTPLICTPSAGCKVPGKSPITFGDNSSVSVYSPIVRRQWDFGDGNVTTTVPGSDSSIAVHTYTRPGIYTVTYRIWTEDDRTASTSRLLRVTSVFPAVRAEWTPEDGPTTLSTIGFTALGSTDIGTPLLAYNGRVRWADLNYDHAFGVGDLVAFDVDASNDYSEGDLRLAPVETPEEDDEALGTLYFPDKLGDGYALSGDESFLASNDPALAALGDLSIATVFTRDQDEEPEPLLGWLTSDYPDLGHNANYWLEFDEEGHLRYTHHGALGGFASDFSTAPTLIESSTGGEQTAVQYDPETLRLRAFGYSGYTCASNYQSINIAPKEDQYVSAVRFELDTERALAYEGALEPWNVYFGLAPTDGETIVGASCVPDAFTGKLARFVGLQMEGDHALSDFDMRGRVDDVADTAAMQYEANLGANSLYQVEILLRPYIQITVSQDGNPVYFYTAPSTGIEYNRFVVAVEGSNAESGEGLPVQAAVIDNLQVVHATEVTRVSSAPVERGLHSLTFERDATARTLKAKVDGDLVIDSTYPAHAAPAGGTLSGFAVGRDMRVPPGEFAEAETRYFDGAFHELRLWKKVVGQAKMDAIVGPGGVASVPEGTETALWMFDSQDHGLPAPGLTRDRSGGNHPLTLSGPTLSLRPTRDAFCTVDVDGSGGFTFGDELFLTRSPCGLLAAGDVRLPPGNLEFRLDAGELLPGTFVRAGDPDSFKFTRTLTGARLSRDAAGNLYFDMNSNGLLGPGEVRLSPVDGRFPVSHVRAASSGVDDAVASYLWECVVGCATERMWPPLGPALSVADQARFLVGPGPGADFRFERSSEDKIVRLTVTDANGDSESVEYRVQLANIPPEAIISYSPAAPTDLDEILFNAGDSFDVDGDIQDYFWDFGDGETSTGKIATHRYAVPGDYYVNLTVTDEGDDLRRRSTTATILIHVSNLAPRVQFTYTPVEPQTLFPVQFDASLTTDADAAPGTALKYEWDFGDPSSVDNTAVGKFATHTYQRRGDYVVRLKVTDDRDEYTVLTRSVHVSNRVPLPQASVDTPIQLPPATLNFNATGSTDPDGTITKFEWDFKDNTPKVSGTPAEKQSVQHTFTQRGVFRVEMTAYDNDGGFATAVVVVTILNQRPLVNVQLPQEAQANISAKFRAFAFDPEGDAITYHWDFGDGTNETGNATPTHTYKRWGNYRVTVTAKDTGNATATASEAIRVVSARPTAKLQASAAKIRLGQSVSFNGNGTDPDGTVQGHFLDFGDGETTFANKATHTYKRPGKYLVLYRVTDESQATGSTTMVIDVENPPPVVGPILVVPDEVRVGDIVLFNANVTDDDPSRLEYFWNFQDGVVSTAKAPTHVFRLAGAFIVEFTVKDAYGAKTTQTVTVEILNPPGITPPPLPTGGTTDSPGSPQATSGLVAKPVREDSPGAGLWATLSLIVVALLMVRRRRC